MVHFTAVKSWQVQNVCSDFMNRSGITAQQIIQFEFDEKIICEMASRVLGVQSVQSLEKCFKSFAHERCGCNFNASPSSAAYICRRTGSALIQVACLVPSHYLEQCCLIVNWTLGNKLSNLLFYIFMNYIYYRCIWPPQKNKSNAHLI